VRFFTADLHFGHANIIRYCGRPFADAEAMDRGLVERWNDVVGDDDTVVVLGDVAMGTVSATLQSVRLLRGEKVLVPGNHDRCWPGARHPERHLDAYESVGFRVVEPHATEIGGEAVSLCHFPFAGDAGPGDPFEAYRPPDAGQWLLCGHVHERWRQRGRAVNVGVDAWGGRPVPEAAVAELIAAGPADRGVLAWA
jgi:calcineurin-like phosphoesterase family protein